MKFTPGQIVRFKGREDTVTVMPTLKDSNGITVIDIKFTEPDKMFIASDGNIHNVDDFELAADTVDGEKLFSEIIEGVMSILAKHGIIVRSIDNTAKTASVNNE